MALRKYLLLIGVAVAAVAVAVVLADTYKEDIRRLQLPLLFLRRDFDFRLRLITYQCLCIKCAMQNNAELLTKLRNESPEFIEFAKRNLLVCHLGKYLYQ